MIKEPYQFLSALAASLALQLSNLLPYLCGDFPLSGLYAAWVCAFQCCKTLIDKEMCVTRFIARIGRWPAVQFSRQCVFIAVRVV